MGDSSRRFERAARNIAASAVGACPAAAKWGGVGVIPIGELLTNLPERERRGSRLTDGSNEDVARRLSALAAPFAIIDSNHLPRGFAEPNEAKLGDALSFLSDEHREVITAWWLAVREHANTPNWDIASTATISGTEGLLLVEAKAHTAEIKTDGKAAGGRVENQSRIGAA
jgi:hypothetical protein